ncbi:MAG: TnsA endonuclease N-terminal domain-containing protein [Coleofasciculus sp. C3-bin4]|nr:TnsA endonuclease N-terminal domain-containing protein [Coleofasciculus sp. C3-bin4]
MENERTIEKFEIERQYWLKRNISWGIVTERELPPALAKNIDWISKQAL